MVIDLVDYLVKKGLFFCDVYEVVVYVVWICVDKGCDLVDLLLDDLCVFFGLIGEDVFVVLMFEGLVVVCDYIGGIVFN